MKISVVDIGSNTIKMKVFEYNINLLKEIRSEVRNAKLISYIENGILSYDGIHLLCKTLTEFKTISDMLDSGIFKCFATASLRKTDNSNDILLEVKNNTGLEIDLVTGDEEAHLSFVGVKRSDPAFPENGILLDMGGGSTEIVLFEDRNTVNSRSMGFGSLSLFLEYSSPNFDEMKQHALNEVDSLPFCNKRIDSAILVGGTALAINKLYRLFFKSKDPYEMSFHNLKELYYRLKNYSNEIISLLEENVPDRTTTVIPGLAAYIGIFERFGVETIKVTTHGIREGYVYEKILKNGELPE